jgi:histidine ammonia-lyase
MEDFHHISADGLTLEKVYAIINEGKKLKLSEEAEKAILKCRRYLDEEIRNSGRTIYGINTGFGSLCNHKIDDTDLEQLQRNLVMSHACGTGEEVPQDIIKIMLFLKIQSLSYGHSGVQLETVNRLIDFFNEDILPVVYNQGSLGASGDLAPLAHLALPLLGEGEVYHQGKRKTAKEVLAAKSWSPINLKSKEGLALLNGTQFMSAYGIWSLIEAYRISYFADMIAAISLDAFDGLYAAFEDLTHYIRPHNGQLKTAERIREFLEGSELIHRDKEQVQDPYSFRCVPQVHGASKDAIEHVKRVLITEINSVTDNPNIFVDEDRVISGGNFHGQPLALSFDFLTLAISELANISERRTYKLIGGERGLPAYLVANPGLNSGFMIPQYTAASIVSQNKQYCTPASADSIVSSNGQEDHVSMGANAATKMYKVIENTLQVLGIELMNASQALNFRKAKTGDVLESFLEIYREEVPFIDDDVYMHPYLIASKDFLSGTEVDPDICF